MALGLIGENLTKYFKMIKKKVKKNNLIAKDLRTPRYKQRLIKNKKVYNRKKESKI